MSLAPEVLGQGEPLSLAHAARVEPWLHALRTRLGPEALADLSFANLYLFRAVHRYQLHGGKWPALSGVCYDGTRHLLPLFDLAELPICARNNWLAGHNCVFPVSADDALRLLPLGWVAKTCVADSDYLYPAHQFRNYHGPLLRKKAAQVQQLLALGTPEAQALCPHGTAKAHAVLAQWLRDKAQPENTADAPAAREALQLLEPLGLCGWTYSLHGAPVGMLMVECYSADTAVVRFAKGVAAVPGIYPFMFQHLCRQMPELRWLNFEQDLGNAGFRQSKRSYQPARQLAKLRLRPVDHRP